MKRPLRLPSLVALGVNGIVGVGIFFAPKEVAAVLPGSRGLWAYVAVTLLLLPTGSSSPASVGFPEDGGPYLYARAAFGARAAFAVGWTHVRVGAFQHGSRARRARRMRRPRAWKAPLRRGGSRRRSRCSPFSWARFRAGCVSRRVDVDGRHRAEIRAARRAPVRRALRARNAEHRPPARHRARRATARRPAARAFRAAGVRGGPAPSGPSRAHRSATCRWPR